MGQISSDLLKKAFVTWQHAFPSTSTTFYDIFARAFAEIKILRKWPTSFGFSFLFNFFFFFLHLSFFSFSYLFAAVIDLLLGLLPVQKFLRNTVIETGKFYHVEATCGRRQFCSECFSQIKFLSVFVHISLSIGPIILIWVSLERYFSPAALEYRWWRWHQKRNKGKPRHGRLRPAQEWMGKVLKIKLKRIFSHMSLRLAGKAKRVVLTLNCKCLPNPIA